MKFSPVSFMASDYGLALITLLVMSVQLIVYEGMAVSIPKVVFMAITPLLILAKARVVTKAILLSLLYYSVTLALLYLQFGVIRMSTLYYTALFLCTFCLYYALVYYKGAFTLDQFIQILKGLIYAYAICLALQQLCFFVGIRYVPLLNLGNLPYYEQFRLNSLGIEPSHSARVLTVYYYALLKLTEIKYGKILPLSELWNEHKRVTIAFLYTMCCMGSGTAFVGLAILSLYFVRKQYAFAFLTIGLIVYLAAPFIDYEPLNRAVNIFNAALTGDTEVVTSTDNSAAARVNIIINTFNIDLTDSANWFGHGTNYGSKTAYAIANYGLISYICKLIFIFSCCFSGFFTLEVLMFILLFSMDVGNIAYGYSVLMVLSTVKYFKLNQYVSFDNNTDI